jgi:hypothetical protein
MIRWWRNYQKRRMFRRLLKARMRISYTSLSKETCTVGVNDFVEWAVIERVFGMRGK